MTGLAAALTAAQEPPADAAPGEQPPPAESSSPPPPSEPSTTPSSDQPAEPTAAPGPATAGTIDVTAPPKPARRKPGEGVTELEDIEVTASKRAKSQRDIPGSVGALRGEDLEQIRAQGMADFMKLIPGVLLTDRGAGQEVVSIRGITSSVGALGSQFTAHTTGLYIDEMPFNDLFVPLLTVDLNPFDLERVEVLKGPQGTLFGASALAGAVRYILAKPNPSVWQAKAMTTVTDTQYGGGPSPVGAAALNIPLFGDALALRAVGLYRKQAGLYDARPQNNNTRNEDNVDSVNQSTGRLLANWNAGDRFKLSGFYIQQNTHQPEITFGSQTDDGFERNDVPYASKITHHFGGANTVASYDFDAARVSYTGNLLRKYSYNVDHIERGLLIGDQQATAAYNILRGKVNGSTHEVRITSPESRNFSAWEWLAGAAYMKYVQNAFQFENAGNANNHLFTDPPHEPDDVTRAEQDASVLWATIDGDGTEKALFGEATAPLGDRVEVTLGLRWFETRLLSSTLIRGAEIQALCATGCGSNPPGETEDRQDYDAHEKGLDPKFSIRYQHTDHVQLYALVAKGYQFGGFQLNPPVVGLQTATERQGFHFGAYKSSTLWNYEAGIRTEWLERRLRFDVTPFYLDWSNLQLTIAVPLNPRPIPVPGQGDQNVGIGVIVNVARAHSEGIETALEVLPFNGAKWTSSASWITAVTDRDFDPADSRGPVRAGTQLPGAPRFQWSNVVAYEHGLPIVQAWSGVLSLTHAYVGPSPDSIRRQRDVGGYNTLDARVDILNRALRYEPQVSLGMNNLTDARGVVAHGGTPGSSTESFYFTRPRTALLSLSMKY